MTKSESVAIHSFLLERITRPQEVTTIRKSDGSYFEKISFEIHDISEAKAIFGADASAVLLKYFFPAT